MYEFHESVPLGPLLRKLTTALCAALGVFLLAVCGFVAIVDGDPTGYVIGTLSVAICFATAVYLWRVRVTIDTDYDGVVVALRPGLHQSFAWSQLESATPVQVSVGSGIGYRMTGAGRRTILAAPGIGVSFRIRDGREITVATDRRDDLIELARRRTPDLR
ncbi:hypothetical protein [Rhodococcus sp. IEGM 1379]|uniref:hypothetical protein n=1 Tax=Rhodococcus sp. IEGM 1379 TaxID=3047086 RepID=UPI0024B7C711|nr:hypothetical protein [Rhodococcus sp. IEGM 1379]MDI9917439.1 hypothetical protein [Rhodococcus sp. IEGM 1379]